MWTGEYETTTDLPAEKLFKAISDINSWSKWDSGLEFTRLEGPAKNGAEFTLKPKGGPNVKMSIDEIKPYILIDTAHLFLAKMRTTHEYKQIGEKTHIYFKIEVWGPLSFFWRRVVGEGQIKEAAVQMVSFTNYVRTSS